MAGTNPLSLHKIVSHQRKSHHSTTKPAKFKISQSRSPQLTQTLIDMAKSSDPSIPVPVLDPGDDRHTQEPKPVRRKMVQSTLFPCKSQANQTNCNYKSGGVDVEDDGDCCGGSQKKRQRRIRKTTTPRQSGTSKMEKHVNVTAREKVVSNGHIGVSPGQCSPIKFEDVSPPGFPCRKVEVKLVQTTLFPCKSEDVEADCNGHETSAEDDDSADEEYCGSQKSRKRKGKTTLQTWTRKKSKERQLNTTPKKNRPTNGRTGTSSGQSSPIVIEEASPPVPNLRLEAKLMAEEISRIYSGKQIHPFFASQRVGKKIHEPSEVENNWSIIDQSDKHTDIGPIHVIEGPQNDNVSFNWKDWTFFEDTLTSYNRYAAGSVSSIFEGSVKAFGFNNILMSSYTSSLTHCWNKVFLNQEVIQNEHPHQTSTIFADVTDEKGSLDTLSHNQEVEGEANELHSFPMDAYECREPIVDQKRSFLSSNNQPTDSLWTDKYQPQKAEEVCGNTESVKLLNEWLHLWHEAEIRNCRNFRDHDKRMKDDDSAYYTSDCDSEYINEGANLKNVLLIKGPAGSGKTAAIYACAKEQGFRVLEANASECRNGTILKHKFGEALQSFWRSSSTKNSVDLKSKHSKKLSFVPHNNPTTDPEKEVIEVIPLSDEEDSHIGTSKEIVYELDVAHDHGELKHLILFEDMDIAFPEDRGFLSAIQEITETAKGPVILTSNVENPVLPENMDRLELCFKALTPKELLYHAHKVCISEKARINPCLLEKFVECCNGDLRKTILCLQYFCLSGKYDQDENLQWLCDPLNFDIAACHQLLPIIYPWDLPSQLSELVDKEISESMHRLTKHTALSDASGDKSIKETTEITKRCGSVIESIEAKKEAMLSRHFSANDCNILATLLDNADELSHSSGTPVAFSRRNARKKSDTIMSSDSDDEHFKVVCSVVSSWDSDDELFPEVDCMVPSPQRAAQNKLLRPAYENLPKESEKPDGQQCPNSESPTGLNHNDNSMLFDVSCVPESSFVPETVDEAEEVSNTLFCGHIANTMEVPVNNEIKNVSSPARADSVDQFAPNLHQNLDRMRHNFCVSLDCSSENFVDNSREDVKALSKFLVMDECSRIDFTKKSRFMERPKPLTVSELVQESWNTLRNCYPDLRQCVTAENGDASHMLKLAYGATKLISEADLLLSKCHLLSDDSFESSTVLSDVSDVFCWCSQQLHLTSTFVQHGFRCYMEGAASLKSLGGSPPVNSLSHHTSALAISTGKGDVVSEDNALCITLPTHPGMTYSQKSEMNSCLDVIESMVPSRSYLTLRGAAFHEYLSSLGHISRSEAIRLSEVSAKMRQRRGRAPRHYLSTGSLMLTPEDIYLLDQCSSYRKT